MTVLWFTTIRLSDESMFCSGTWIEGLSDALLEVHPEVTLVNVCPSPGVTQVTEETVRGRKQIVVPAFNKVNKSIIDTTLGIINRIQPDVIEVWGVEGPWAQLPFETMVPHIPAILAMQGLMGPVRDAIFADLTFWERIRCIGLKEILRPRSSLFYQYYYYNKKAKQAASAIRRFRYISSQSSWVTAHIKAINPDAKVLSMRIALRKAYYDAPKWDITKADSYTIFAVTGARCPLKGVYTLIKAFNLVHKLHPEAKLRIAGLHHIGIRRSSFQRMLEQYIRSNGLQKSISFIGELNTVQMIHESLKARVYVNPSFTESYSLTTSENTYLGTPTIASYVGTMPELDSSGSIIFHSCGDYILLSHQLSLILTNDETAQNKSISILKNAEIRHSKISVANNEYLAYRCVVDNNI